MTVTFSGSVNKRFGGAYVRLFEKVQRWCPRLFGFLAVNYIGKYVLTVDTSHSTESAREEVA